MSHVWEKILTVQGWFRTIMKTRRGQTWNLSQTLHGQDFSIICLPDKRVNYDKVTFTTKQCILYIHIVSHIKYSK